MSPAAPLLGPGGRELTAEQAVAVRERDGAMILAANAGSGKTTVLVERFVRHVTEDDLDPRSILAITFTRRAAGELRRRVRERLMELGRTEDAHALEGAWITTIDGFCARLLKGHAVLAGVDPRFTVLEPAELRALRERAWERAATDVLAGEDAGGPAERLLTLAGWDELRGIVATVHEERRSAGQARPRLPVPPLPDVAGAGSRLAAAAATLAAELAAGERFGQLKTITAAHAVAQRAAAEVGADPGRVLEPEQAAALACRLRRDVPELGTAACTAYADAHAAHTQACVDRRARPALLALDALLEAYGEALAAEKRAVGGMDFADLALGARDLLRARPELAAAYRERLVRVMVDEFQDTNRLQLDLLDALGSGQLFAVGDLLQSIYAFRHADVRVFTEVWDRLAAAGRARELATNFRARPELLTVINGAWAGVHERYVSLRAGRDVPRAPAPCVELQLVDAQAWEALADDAAPLADLARGLPSAPRVVQAEARRVARRVAELIAEGGRQPGEVVVLLRSGTYMAVYERALEAARVPAVATQGRGWWTRREVQDLLHHLRVLVNPLDEPALLGALAAPFAALGADVLALLAEERRARGSALWPVTGAAAAGDREGLLARLAPAERARLAAYAGFVAAERETAARLGPGELLERAMRACGYEAAVLAGPGGARRVANARKLVALAHAFERRAGRELRAFADFAAAELEADEPTPDAPIDLGDAQAVRLMTVHGAKGLEFPVVVVADLGRRPGGNGPDVLVRGDRVGLRVPGLGRARETAFAYAELEAERRAAEQAEERRVMHVAVTRAEELLILSGTWDPEHGWPGAGHRAPALAWLGPGLWDAAGEPPAQLTVRDGEHVAQVAVSVDRPGSAPVVPAATPPAPVPAAAAGAAPAAAPAAPPAADVQAAPDPAAGPATLSYSSLTEYHACPYSWYLRRVLRLPRRDASDLAGLVPAGRRDDALIRGTVAHLVLEHADLGRPGAPSDEAIRAAAARAGVELDDAQVADQARLAAAFLDSPLRARVAACADIRREAPFAYPLADAGGGEGPIVRGVVDLIARDGGRALVVDYKTDRLCDRDDPEVLVGRDYPIQRALYALAALRGGADDVEVIHLFLARPQAPAAATFTRADVPALEAALREAAAGLLGGTFPVAPEPHAGLCATCPGRGGLCSWPDERTGRPDPRGGA